MKVVQLKTSRDLDVESAIETLESALAETKAGGVAAVSVSIVYHDGSCSHGHSSTEDATALVGAIEISKMRVMQQALDEEE